VNILAFSLLQAVDSKQVDHLVKLQIPCSIDPKVQFIILESLIWMA